MRINGWIIGFPAWALSAGFIAVSPIARAAGPAGVRIDGTLGGAAQVLPGPVYAIGQNLGKLSGSNLFFSFQYFNVAGGETARFTTSSAGISNVISRVTGGYSSTIDGTIALVPVSGAPNFFLVNPSGVTFTANARTNVPAALYVTTADYVKFGDGNFYANPATKSTLSAAAPAAFGFLGTSRAPVQVLGSQLFTGNTGAPDLQLVAGDVTIDGAGGQAFLVDSFGRIRLTAVGSAVAEVPLTGSFASTDGAVTVSNGALIATGGAGGMAGSGIDVNAGSFTVDGGTVPGSTALLSLPGTTAKAAPISVAVSGNVSLLNGGRLSATTSGAGDGGNIALQAGSLMIEGGETFITGISTASTAAGAAGNIAANVAGNATINNGGSIAAYAFGSGNAGQVAISAQNLNMDGKASGYLTQISAATYGAGNAGSINLQLGSLSMSGSTAAEPTLISTSASGGSLGLGGNLTIAVKGDASLASGAAITANTFGAGTSGNLTLSAQNLSIAGGSSSLPTEIAASSFGPGNAGQLSVKVGSLSIDGGSSAAFTGIASQGAGGSGSAGGINVMVGGTASIVSGGEISSSTSGTANAGDITVNAQNLTIEGRDSALPTGILADTFGSGNAGQINVTVGSLSIEGGTTSTAPGISSNTALGSGAAGNIVINDSGGATLTNGAAIASTTNASSGNAGQIDLTASSLTMDGGSAAVPTAITSAARAGAAGNGGQVNVNIAGAVSILNGATITSDTSGSGAGGEVMLHSGSLTIDGGPSNATSGISSNSDEATSGSAGEVMIDVVGDTTIRNGGQLGSGSFGSGNGGPIQMRSGSLTIDGGTFSGFTGIASQQNSTGSGAAGDITLTITGGTSLVNGGQISSGTFGSGRAGQVNLSSATLVIDGGEAGILSNTNPGATGAAGNIVVNVSGAASIAGGSISSGTDGSGNAGQIRLQAGSLSIDGGNGVIATGIGSQANTGSTGQAGDIMINVLGPVSVLDAGQISSSTFASGNAGQVSLKASSLTVDGLGASSPTAIGSSAQPGSAGSGGALSVDVTGAVELSNGGALTTTTFGAGAAGQVDLQSGSLSIDGGHASQTTGLLSRATSSSGGQPGVVNITTGQLDIVSGGTINISNQATVANPAAISPTQIRLAAQNITMNDATITAQSTGNVAASAIDISFTSALRMDPSSISTSSNDGNGGSINISGLGPIFLNHSTITTSVVGNSNGNGGNITIAAPEIVFDTGVIQANTFAPLASGGTVSIDSSALVPTYQSYVLGGSPVVFTPTALGLNVVQAAAPDGIAGVLNVTVPTLDLGNSLLGLTGHPAAPTALGRGLCGYTRGSSLAVVGRGGLAPSAGDPLWIDVAGTGLADSSQNDTTTRGAVDVAGGAAPGAQLHALFVCR